MQEGIILPLGLARVSLLLLPLLVLEIAENHRDVLFAHTAERLAL